MSQEPSGDYAVYALMWESVNVTPSSGPHLVRYVYSQAEADDWVANSPSIFVRRYSVLKMIARTTSGQLK